jgi:hypothetical protein
MLTHPGSEEARNAKEALDIKPQCDVTRCGEMFAIGFERHENRDCADHEEQLHAVLPMRAISATLCGRLGNWNDT